MCSDTTMEPTTTNKNSHWLLAPRSSARRRKKSSSKEGQPFPPPSSTGELSDAPEHSQPDGRPKFIQKNYYQPTGTFSSSMD
ncbi:hypothetical protein CEXT_206901 [Caerostris extrusa]|uniref:Uncharacterized protein n=1 Tax=Caerostris extrusa TaxID=172846 RepID=A0AAV4XL32_CAEEX|nr:hypothetical protein CEXT_206901 [Caerostris extrusa]